MKDAFSQGAWPQATDYANMIDSFALVGELPDGQNAETSRQQIVKIPAGSAANGQRCQIAHNLKKFPCVNVYVEDNNVLRKVDEVIVELKGTTAVMVTVRSQTVDVAQTGMTVVLS